MNLVTLDQNEKNMTWTSRYLDARIKELSRKIEKLNEKRDQHEEELAQLSSCMGEIKVFEQLAFPLDKAS